jgi:hypothetical protein
VLGREAVDDLEMLQETFSRAWPDHLDCVAAGLRQLVGQRPISPEIW